MGECIEKYTDNERCWMLDEVDWREELPDSPLGMMYTEQIIRAHHAAYNINTKLKHGSTFWNPIRL